jgi:hypothetical protein
MIAAILIPLSVGMVLWKVSLRRFPPNHGTVLTKKQAPEFLGGSTAYDGLKLDVARVRARAATPFCPQVQTSSACPGMSVWCHEKTHAPQQLVALFDHLVGAQLTIPPSMGGIVWTGKHNTLQPRLAAT